MKPMVLPDIKAAEDAVIMAALSCMSDPYAPPTRLITEAMIHSTALVKASLSISTMYTTNN